MLQIVKKNLAKLSNYPRLRIFLIIVAIIIVFVLVMNLLTPSASKNSAPPSRVQSVSSKHSLSTKSAPSNQQSQYKNLTQQDQARSEKKAVQTGGSIFETGKSQTSSIKDVSPSEFAKKEASEKKAETKTEKNNSDKLTKQIESLQKQLNTQSQNQHNVHDQQAALRARQRRAEMNTQLNSIANSMRSGVQQVAAGWKLPTLATVQGTRPSSHTSGAGTGSTQGPVAIKAGTILFGVIDTALSSDSPGTPVLATVVTGPYKGAKLLGGFTATKNALVIQFNLMTMPNSSSSISINAYAIDAKTANNAIATDVDNHYLLRYGMLFASAFLQGFGSAYQNYTYCPPGTQNCSVINTNGSSNLPSNDVTTRNAMYQGLGQIGTTLGQAAAQQFNTPPSITVDQGTGIGVLFMSDVRLSL